VRIAEWIVLLIGTYAAIGLVFGIAFVFAGAKRVDPVAQTAGFGFRLMILPGSAALWPVLLRKWLRGGHD
jgi:hypothetical protein